MPRTNAHAVVLEILRQADGEWNGKNKLFKTFYFAHLYYASRRPGLLTDWPIARMPQGPGIHDSDRLFHELVVDGLIEIEPIHEGPYPEYRYRLTQRGREATALPEDAAAAIRDAVLYCKDKTAAELSTITHERSRSWNDAQDGDLLDIDIDTIPEDEYLLRQEELKKLGQSLNQVFGEASS